MPGIARYYDLVVGICSGHITPISTTGFIITTSSDVKANSLGIARNSDIVLASCGGGHIGIIVTSSGSVKSNGLGIARMGDTVTGVFSGTIVQGSPDVNSN